MMTLVSTKSLAQRIEQSEIEALESRLTAVKEIDGNPMGVEIKKFGNASAFFVKNIPGPSFNTVKGISETDITTIDHILDFYNERNVPARFEITPAHASPELLLSLSEKGYAQCDFHTALYGSLINDLMMETEANTSISIRQLQQNEFDIFGDIYTKGFSMPSFLKEHVAQNNKILYSNTHWSFYLAEMDCRPAGVGVLFENEGIGTLAASATMPELRNNGVHGELIVRRLKQAKKAGCNLAVGQAAYGSASHRNMERAGMKVAYTKAIWTKVSQ